MGYCICPCDHRSRHLDIRPRPPGGFRSGCGSDFTCNAIPA